MVMMVPPQETRLQAVEELLASSPGFYQAALKLCRERALADPWFFIKHVLGYELTEFHKEWFEFQLRHPRTILLAPRGHGKSTICDISFVLWRLIHDQNMRVLIASKTLRQAALFLAEIKQQMQRPLFRALFGDWVYKDEWKEWQIRIPRSKIMKEPTITAIGMGGSLPTWHFDLIILDDVHDLSNARTAGQREQVWRWFEAVVLPTLEPTGEIHVIGTRWDADDLYGRLIAKSEEAKRIGDIHGVYEVLVSKALIDERAQKVLWPERWPFEKLMAIKREEGPVIFALQFQCDAGAAMEVGPVFRAADFKIATEEDVKKALRRAIYVAQAWDLATGEKEILGPSKATSVETDYTACVTVVLTKDLEFFVVDWWRGKPGLKDQIRMVNEMAVKWSPHIIGIEAVAYQKVLAQHMLYTTTLPIKPLTPDRDKVRRAWAVQPYVETGRVWISQELLELRDLLVAFPFGEEDDSVDAFCYAMQLAARQERFARAEEASKEYPGAKVRRQGF